MEPGSAYNLAMELTPILLVHILGGAVSLLAGTLALIFRKGRKNHINAGTVFVFAMLLMALPGGVVALQIGKPFDALSSVLVCYLVLSAMFAFKPGAYRLPLMAFGCITMAGYLGVELYALATGIRATDAPSGAGYVFATILALAVFGDFKHRGEVKDRRGFTVRHMWRMCFALFMSTASFFGARPHLFPEWMAAYGVLLLLTFAPVVVMIYWRWKLRAT